MTEPTSTGQENHQTFIDNAFGVALGENPTVNQYFGKAAPDESKLRQTIGAYLKEVREQDDLADTYDKNLLKKKDLERALKRLWHDTQFRASEPGGTSGDLYEQIMTVFERGKELHRMRAAVTAGTGMGKTPALYYLRRKFASDDGSLMKPDKPLIPILVSLKELTRGVSFRQLVRDSINGELVRRADVSRISTDDVEWLEQRYTFVLLLDDLEALFSKSHRDGFDIVLRYVDKHSDFMFVFTCRKTSYREQLGPMHELLLDDLTKEEVELVLGEDFPSTYQYVQETGRNRALLNAVLELVAIEGRPEELTNVARIYERIVERRLQKLPERGKSSNAYREMADGLLERLAYAMQRDHTYSYGEEEVMEVVKDYLAKWNEPFYWRDVAAALREAELLARDNRRQWSFSDRKMAAYFAARAVLQDPKLQKPILQDLSDYWWQEMLVMLVGLMIDPTDLVLKLVDGDVLVAANCVDLRMGSVGGQAIDALIGGLIERMFQENSFRRRYIVERIGESKHPRVPEALLRALEREWSSLVTIAIARALKKWADGDPNGMKAIREAEATTVSYSSRAPYSVANIVKLYGLAGNPCEENALIERLRNRRLPALIRGLAAAGLGCFAVSQRAQDALFDVADSQRDASYVVWCAVEALAQMRSGGVAEQANARRLKTPSLKGKRTENPARADRRARLTYLLGRVSREPETSKVLFEASLTDPSQRVRCYAIDAMTQLNLEGARRHIEGILQAGSDGETTLHVLRKATEALAQIGTVESIFVLKRFLDSPHGGQLRLTVRKAIKDIRERHGIQEVEAGSFRVWE